MRFGKPKMKRRDFLVAMIVTIGVAGPAVALSTKDALVRKLRGQGFETIKIGRTLLGRTRIIAESPKYRREIVFNPRTGEILRDYWVNLRTGESIFAPDNGAVGGEPSGEGSGGDDSGGDNDNGDDDDDHDDGDDDDGNDDDHDGEDDHDDEGGGDDDDGDGGGED